MQNRRLRISIAQSNLLVGDTTGNVAEVLQRARDAHGQGVRLLLFPELTLTGYPPEDLLLRPSIARRIDKALQTLIRELPYGIAVVVGYPRQTSDGMYNAVGVLMDGNIIAEYCKHELPNYRVFDEKRYFVPGTEPSVFTLDGIRIGLSICEDIWHEMPARLAKDAGAELLVNINASPFHVGKSDERHAVVSARARDIGIPVIYANAVGGQDELVFDGASFVMNESGEVLSSLPAFEQAMAIIDLVETAKACWSVAEASIPIRMSDDAAVYAALVLGVRDYVSKNGFKGAILGLSGGIDSALTLAVAADALGAERVDAVMMPFRYTSNMSLEDAEAEARLLGVNYRVRAIEEPYAAFMSVLEDDFRGMAADKTEENLQARCRGVMLMALSNKKGYLVLTTGNKSEMAVGYATLYGDMAGGFDVLKDVPKTWVFRLAEYRNALTPDAPPIPRRVIERPPSAELAPDQKDEDSLPPYPVLDDILKRYIEEDHSADMIIDAGFDRAVVERVIRMVDINEYKRRQAAIGPRVTPRGFGRDRRYPVTFRWPAGD